MSYKARFLKCLITYTEQARFTSTQFETNTLTGAFYEHVAVVVYAILKILRTFHGCSLRTFSGRILRNLVAFYKHLTVAFYEHFSRILRTFNVFLRTFNCRILLTFNCRILLTFNITRRTKYK